MAEDDALVVDELLDVDDEVEELDGVEIAVALIDAEEDGVGEGGAELVDEELDEALDELDADGDVEDDEELLADAVGVDVDVADDEDDEVELELLSEDELCE